MTDSASPSAASAVREFALSVQVSQGSPPTVTTTSPLTNGTLNTPYSKQLAASGGTPPYTWSVTQGALPSGLTLLNGVLSGTPSAAGGFTFTVRVADSGTPIQTATQELNLQILMGLREYIRLGGRVIAIETR